MTLDETTRYLHDQIPITRHMGAAVEAFDGTTVRLAAPLAPNHNHRSTAFGGSLAMLGILAGWTLLHLNLRERGIDASLVIQRSEISFEAPVDGDFTATSTLPDPRSWERFLTTLHRHKKARIHVRGLMRSPSGDVGPYEGVYVALRAAPAAKPARASPHGAATEGV